MALNCEPVMNKEGKKISESPLERAMQALLVAERLEDERLNFGADHINVDTEDVDEDWLEDWGEDDFEFDFEEDEFEGNLELTSDGNGASNAEEFTYKPLTREEQWEAVERLVRWLEENPESKAVLAQYLDMVRGQGSRRQQQEAIANASVWLESHPEAEMVREKYLLLVRSAGSPEEQQDAIAKTASWLQSHADDRYVREKYLMLLSDAGTSERQQEAIALTSAWLEDRPGERYVRAEYLTLIQKAGTPEQQEAAAAKTEAWLEAHPQDIYVREQYRALKRMLDKPSNPLVNLARWSDRYYIGSVWHGIDLGRTLAEILGRPEENLAFRRDSSSSLGSDPGSPEKIQELVQSLHSNKDEERILNAAAGLGEIGAEEKEAIAALESLIESTEDDDKRWQAALILGILDPRNPKAGFRKARLIELGSKLDREEVVLIVDILPEEDRTIIRLRLQRIQDSRRLPRHLQFIILDESGETIYEEKTSEPPCRTIEHSLTGNAGDLFRVKMALEEFSITESFAI